MLANIELSVLLDRLAAPPASRSAVIRPGKSGTQPRA